MGGNSFEIAFCFGRVLYTAGLRNQNMLTRMQYSYTSVPAFQAGEFDMIAVCNAAQSIASAYSMLDCIQHAVISRGQVGIECGKFVLRLFAV